jgi:periplasmic protein TonB
MFDIFLPEMGARWKNVRKALTLSLSLVLHALLIAAVIVVPLLRAEANLPAFKSTEVRIVSPILPGVPPAGHGKGHGKITKPGEGKPKPSDPRGPAVLTAPIEVPTTIVEEDPTIGIPGEGSGPGVEGGAGDGSEPWEIGDEIKPDEINPAAVPITTVRPPRLIKRVNPEYPPIAIVSRVSGKVEIVASTDIYGRVNEARVTSGNALLNGAALEAVKKWIYEPYLVNGIPRPVRFTVTITFSLETR